MFQWFQKMINVWRVLQFSSSEIKIKYIDPKLKTSVSTNVKTILSSLENSADVNIREFSAIVSENKKLKFALIYIKGLVDLERIRLNIIGPLLDASFSENANPVGNLSYIKDNVLSISQLSEEKTLSRVLDSILEGNTILLVDGCEQALSIGTKGWEKRAITDSQTDVTVRGPKEGFTETLITNTSMIRRILRNPKLKFESFTLGTQTNTHVCIAYLHGMAQPNIVNEVKRRLKKIQAVSILESGYIEALISDRPYALFPTVFFTERPDVIAAKLLEGRVAILIDGTPMVLTVPKLFVEVFQHPEDYYRGPAYISTIFRMIKFASFLISTLLPGIYVAIVSYHIEMIPTVLLRTIYSAVEGTPFPAPLSTLLMLFIADILNQASLQLPRQVGQAVSIVGALVLGDAAVSAGIIGAPIVVVVGLSVISSYAANRLNEAISILRIIFVVLATLFGAIGIGIGLLFLLSYLNSITSFGVPFLEPFTPINPKKLNDALYRGALKNLVKPKKPITPHHSPKKAQSKRK